MEWLRTEKWLFFFFQAEDGIRDFHVTGVQTCALPISDGGDARRHEARLHSAARHHGGTRHFHHRGHGGYPRGRSEERRVGKECRSGRASLCLEKKKEKAENSQCTYANGV